MEFLFGNYVGGYVYRFGKSLAGLTIAGALALSGCGAATDSALESEAPNAPAAEMSPSVEPTIDTAKLPPEAVTPNLADTSPMGQDIAALEAASALDPQIYQSYSSEEIIAASTFGLNWLEQMVAIPELYSADRDPTKDDLVILSEFIKPIRPMYQSESTAKMSVGGGHLFVPVADETGHWMDVVDDGGRKMISSTWLFDGAPESIEWTNLGIEYRTSKDSEPLVAVSATANYPVVDDNGNKGVQEISFMLAVIRSSEDPSAWNINGWKWDPVQLVQK